MARNKFPEETVNLIVDKAMGLFIDKGYEHTSVQDIIDELGGLTKGAIYHHFKSKEEIMLAAAQKMFDGIDESLAKVRDAVELNGLEKLRAIFEEAAAAEGNHDLFRTAPDLVKNSRLLALQLQDIMEETVPHYIQPIIEEGIRDGSIQTDYPKELAEIVVLMSNLWLNPMIFGAGEEELERRMALMRQMLGGIGVDIISDGVAARYREFWRSYNEK